MRRVVIVLQSSENKDTSLAIWQRLRTLAKPFPFEVDHEDPAFGLPNHTDFTRGEAAAASLTPKGVARIALSDTFFNQPEEQLGVLFHELVHIRLFLGRFARCYRRMKEIETHFNQLPPASNAEDARLGEYHWAVVAALIQLPHEIGVDTYMALPGHDWLSQEVWTTRARAFHQGYLVLSDNDCPAVFRPYVLFHRLLATELGLRVLPDIAEKPALVTLRDERLNALREACDERLFNSLSDSRRRLLAIDVSTNDEDPDSYSEVADAVQALSIHQTN